MSIYLGLHSGLLVVTLLKHQGRKPKDPNIKLYLHRKIWKRSKPKFFFFKF